MWSQFFHCLADMHHSFILLQALDAVIHGYRFGEFQHLFVQEWHAQLQAVGHAHFVRFQQNVPGQPHVHVQILLLRHFILSFDTGVERRGQLMSQRPVVVSGLQHGAGLVLREYTGNRRLVRIVPPVPPYPSVVPFEQEVKYNFKNYI